MDWRKTETRQNVWEELKLHDGVQVKDLPTVWTEEQTLNVHGDKLEQVKVSTFGLKKKQNIFFDEKNQFNFMSIQRKKTKLIQSLMETAKHWKASIVGCE